MTQLLEADPGNVRRVQLNWDVACGRGGLYNNKVTGVFILSDRE